MFKKGCRISGVSGADVAGAPEERMPVRTRAGISGIFTSPDLGKLDLDVEEGELLIEREILAGGKSRAFIGSRPAAAALLREIAPLLGDIHGQHEQQLLFSSDAQLRMLDLFAGAGESVRDLFAGFAAAGKELSELERTEQEKLRLLDLWNCQKKEIEIAAPKPGEDSALEQERRLLMNLGRVQENAGAAFAALYDSPESALALIRAATKK